MTIRQLRVATMMLLLCSVLPLASAAESSPESEGMEEGETSPPLDEVQARIDPTIKKESWRLAVGQSRSIHIEPGSHLRFSRRGVVDPIQTGEQDWTLIGLQKGVVSLVVQAAAPGARPRASRSILIEVSQPLSQQSTLPIPEWPPHPLCTGSAEIRCDKTTKTVSGQLSRWQDYLDLKRACTVQSVCWFSATLTPSAKADWTRIIQERLAPVTRFELRADDILVLWHDCAAARSDDRDTFAIALAERIYPRQDIYQRCNGDGPKDSYLLKVKVYLADENALQEWGLDPLFNKRSASQLRDGLNLSSLTLHDLETSKSATLIAQPTMLINTQTQVTILSGGEVQAATQLAQHTTSGADHLFKKVGLDLKVFVTRMAASLLRVSYQVSLSSHNNPSSGAINLASTAFAGELDLLIGTPMVIGGTRLSSEGSSVGGSLLLSGIPIVGPLFTMTQTEKVNRLALLWLQLCPPPRGQETTFRLPSQKGDAALPPIQDAIREDCTNTHDQSSSG